MSTRQQRYLILDHGTFGNSAACHILVDMMNENMISESQKRKVLSYLNDVNTQFKWIATISYWPVMERTLKMMFHHLIDRVDELNFPLIFKSHMQNVVAYMYKKALKNWRSELDNRRQATT